MKFDWNLARTILAHIEAETFHEFIADTESMKQWKEGQLLSERVDNPQPPEIRAVLTHIKLLRDGGFITGVEVRESSDGCLSIALAANPGLSLAGVSLLESLRADGFISKLKKFAQDNAVPLTLETVKALSAALIKSMF